MSEESASLEDVQADLAAVREQVARRIVGQQDVIDQILACLLADGNALLESNPGLAKTLTVRTVAQVTDLSFSRIQNTPDLMPSDITGTEIIRESEGGRDFVFQRGPVFANIVLADEINRATPKTQAALLEAMEEKQVTAAGETYELPDPFFLLATQNPIDMEGSLHPDEDLYLNGRLWTAAEVLKHARAEGNLIHDGDTRVYEIDGTTIALDEDGELREAPAMVYETQYEGEVFTVETKTGRTTRVSGNHPFLVNRAGAIRWVEARDLEDGDHLVTPKRLDVRDKPFPTHEATMERLETHEGFTVIRRDEVCRLREKLDSGQALTADEIDALRIVAGLSKTDLASATALSYDRVLNYLGGARNDLRESLTSELRSYDIAPADYVEAFRIHRIDDVLDLSDAGFFIGFILAEGRIENGQITVSQKNLPDILDRWIDIAERVGLNVTVNDHPTGRRARIDSKPFVAYLDARFSLTTPETFLSAPEAFRKEFLEVFLLTESHFDEDRRRITFVQKDRTITNVIAYLLLEFDIVPWIYDRDERFELRVQGTDLSRYLDQFPWRGDPPDVEVFESVHRTTPIPLEPIDELIDTLGLKHEGKLSERSWYNSVRNRRGMNGWMATAQVEQFLDDVDRSIARRKASDIRVATQQDLGTAAKSCGLSMMDVAHGSDLNKNRIWDAYTSDARPPAAVNYVVEEYTERIEHAEDIAQNLRSYVNGDVFYDRVTAIESEPYDGTVIGLSVPEYHNYVAGFGACGINHNTYELPEAQADRFLMKILLDYPSFDEEREIVDRYTKRLERYIPVDGVLTRDELLQYQRLTRQVPIADDIRDRAIQIIQDTRTAETVEFGASPRASMGLVVAAKARALIQGRAHVSEADIEAMAAPVLRHRIIVDFRAEREGMTPDDVIADLL